MPLRHGSRAGAWLAVLAAVVLHAQLGVSLWIWDRLHGEEPAADVEVEYVAADEANLRKEDLPPAKVTLPPPPSELGARREKSPEKAAPSPEAQKPAEQKPEEKQAEKTPPPPEQPPPPPPQQPPPTHMKMVEQQYEKDEADNPNARFLGEKNKHVEEETRATETNLERESKGGEQSSPNANHMDQVGDEARKIAELEDKKSELGKKAPHVTPHVQEELPSSKAEKQAKSLLSMRELQLREHENVPKNALPRSPDGTIPVPEHGGAPMARDQEGHRKGQGQKLKLNLTGEDHDKIFGKTVGAERQMAETERSRRPGKWEQRWGAIKSSLENFIPEVRAGNQTELGTRASPFAAFIARMHRSIHKLWGFDQLDAWDRKESSNPFNNMELWSMIEIVLNGDGTIDKLTIVRPSGFLPFDVAAMDTVMSAGPYPDPPAAIKSANGKIYLHWRFHRDDRACGTFGVDPYILSTPPKDTVQGDTSEVPKGKVLAEAGGIPGPGAGQGAALPAPPPVPRAAPRMLSRSGGGGGGAHRPNDEGWSEPDPAYAARAASKLVHPNDPEARKAAEQWLAAYRKGDAGALAGASSLPFRSGGRVAARDAGALSHLYKALLQEAPAKRDLQRLNLYSASQVRSSRGVLPQSGDDGAGQLFAVGKVGGEEFVLVLAKVNGNWRVVGLDR